MFLSQEIRINMLIQIIFYYFGLIKINNFNYI